jgi:hypothetical protein
MMQKEVENRRNKITPALHCGKPSAGAPGAGMFQTSPRDPGRRQILSELVRRYAGVVAGILQLSNDRVTAA